MILFYNSTLIRVFYLFFFLSLYSCNYEKDKYDGNQENNSNQQSINLNLSFLKCIKCNDSTIPKIKKSKYKILVYGDFYCTPCFDSFKIWENYYDLFVGRDNVVFVPIVYALLSDYEMEQKYLFNDSIAVFIDNRNRFRIVNKLGNNPESLSMLLDHNNKIIHYGIPSNETILNKYIEIIDM